MYFNSLLPAGRRLEEQDCHHPRQFVVGFKALFFKFYGAVRLELLCDVPDWDATPEGRNGEDAPAPMRFSTTLQALHWPDFREAPILRCPEGEAVCGLNTKVPGAPSRAYGPGRVRTGINDVQLKCCPFPFYVFPVTSISAEVDGV